MMNRTKNSLKSRRGFALRGVPAVANRLLTGYRGQVLCHLLMVLVSMSVAQGRTTPTFKFTSINYQTAGSAEIVSGDFNGDGRIDLIAGDQLFFGSGDGRFKSPVSINAPPGRFIVNDFDRDGKLDLLALRSGFIEVFLGKGDGSFQAPVKCSFTGRAILAADFNNDGLMDVAGLGGMGLNVLLGSGKGTFQPLVS